MKSESFQRGFLLILVTVVTLVFAWMIHFYLITLLFAAMFTSLCWPLFQRFMHWTKNRKPLASGLTLLTFVLLILLPFMALVAVLANEAVNVTNDVTPWVQDKLGTRAKLDRTIHRLPGFQHLAPYSDQIVDKTGSTISGLGNMMFKTASALTTGTLVLLVNFAIMLYAMFFFFISGPELLEKIFYYIPLRSRDEKKLLQDMRSMARATIKGIFIIGVIQGFLAALAFWVVGIPSVIFWGTVMALLSVVPNVGSALVWVPACVYLFVKGETGAGVGLFLWCALVVGTIDNFLRPILVGKDTEMNELLIFLSTIGGLAMFGLEGFILGPILALLFITVWEIYGHAFKDVLPKPGDLD